MNARGIPRPLRAKLERTGELISANELQRQIRRWKRCRDCGDSGIIGNALDKTLFFCSCPAGIEEMYVKGAGWSAEEVARVHTDSKSLLVEACHTIGRDFTADAIVDSRVTHRDGVLEVRCSDRYFDIDQGDVIKAVELLKWQCCIAITGGRRQLQSVSAADRRPAVPSRPLISDAEVA